MSQPGVTVRTEYRVTWHRAATEYLPTGHTKEKRYWSMRHALRWIALLGDEPWKAFPFFDGKSPEDRACCDGWECGCGGMTIRQHFMERRKELPPVEWVRLEARTVTQSPWSPSELQAGVRR